MSLIQILYNTDKYSFHRPLVKNLCDTKPNYPLFLLSDDAKTLKKKFERTCGQSDSFFLHIYREFIKDIIKPQFGVSQVSFSRNPEFYVQTANELPKANRINEVYPGTQTIIVPFTPIDNSICVEKNHHGNDWLLPSLQYGDVIMFDGVHAHLLNDKLTIMMLKFMVSSTVISNDVYEVI